MSSTSQIVEFFLTKGTTIAPREARAQRTAIYVVAGRLWVTQTGQAQDIFVLPGQTIHIAARPGMVIEADGDTHLRIERAASLGVRMWARIAAWATCSLDSLHKTPRLVKVKPTLAHCAH